MALPIYKGAKFHKCDFQVHTVRDAQWAGPFDPITGRASFAEALVEYCRRKGIGAIAITDHHDLAMWRFIQDAAQQELIEGVPYPVSDRLVVFPGVELTLSTPSCQVLLLLDPDLSDDTLNHIWGALGIIPSPLTQEKTTETVQLDVQKDIENITHCLAQIRTNPAETNPNKFKFLTGRFILLPHVGDGHKSIMRDGFHTTYARMPFVGGYIEHAFYSDQPEGNRNVLEGRVSAWGSKAIGVFQTSDCRKVEEDTSLEGSIYDFVNLGSWPTWVKWAEPSTEAVRQACLARQSRISQIEPTYPLFQIIGVSVSDSEFMGKVELGLSPQFNAFIGGRGTGKSSLLEYVRWALCDDPGETIDSIELPNYQKRRRVLVDETLKPKSAKVIVYYKKNEVVYEIERDISSTAGTVIVRAPNSTSQAMTYAQIRREFPVVSYAQKQLSSVGTLPDEIHRLITDPIKDKLQKIEERIQSAILPQLRDQYTKQARYSTLSAQLAETASSVKGKREQVQALQSQLQSLTPAQQQVISSHEVLTQQDQILNCATELPVDVAKLLKQARDQIAALGIINVPESLPDTAAVKSIAQSTAAYSAKAQAQLDTLVVEGATGNWLGPIERDLLGGVRSRFGDHLQQYAECIKDSAKNQKQLEEIRSLNNEINELENRQSKMDAERNSLRVVLEQLSDGPWQTLLNAAVERVGLLQAQCKLIGEQAEYEFRPKLVFCGDARPVVAAIASLLEGRSVRDSEAKSAALAQIVTSAKEPIAKWQEVMNEFDALVKSRGSNLLPSSPNLVEAGFTGANLESLRGGLAKDSLDQVRFLNIPDKIEFEFRMGIKLDGTENYIPFLSASPGQQATCLLRTLLAQSGAPLLIDQPEEDLDNEQIQLLSERIAETKHNRQLLFVSHNANIVVNGDAELVACFVYRDPSDNTRGKIDPIGSIDCGPVRDSITSVMEGGRRAFELRKQKYGF